jgi:hypothetical protein
VKLAAGDRIPAMSEPFSPGDPLPVTVLASWANRPIAVEQARIAAIYARFHAPLAVLSSIVAVLPLFAKDMTIDDTTVAVNTYAGNRDLAILLPMLLLALATLMTIAAFRGRRPVVPALSGLVGLAILLTMYVGLGPEDSPALSAPGIAAAIIAVWSVPVGVAHAIHISRARLPVPGTD